MRALKDRIIVLLAVSTLILALLYAHRPPESRAAAEAPQRPGSGGKSLASRTVEARRSETLERELPRKETEIQDSSFL